jgi:hypothetical protein
MITIPRRTDLPTMHYRLDDTADSWHLGAVDPSGWFVAISSFYRETTEVESPRKRRAVPHV